MDQRHDATTPREEPCEELDRIASTIVEAAFQVHRHLGPGLLERVYEACLIRELKSMGCRIEAQVAIPLHYKGEPLGENLRLDLLVDGQVVVEIKAVESVLPVHRAQVISYLRLASKPLGLLINFHTSKLKDGISRLLP